MLTRMTKEEEKIHMEIRNGKLRGKALFDHLNDMLKTKDRAEVLRYVDSIFRIDYDPIYNIDQLPKHAEQYMPSHVGWVLDMAEILELTKDDIFYDLGCGRGLVTNLMALLTPAKIKGVELFYEYVFDARSTAYNLKIPNVKILHNDVRRRNYDDATVFYTFNPFPHHVLRDVLAKIKEISKTKKIRFVSTCNTWDVKAYGRGWLTEVDLSNYTLRYMIFGSQKYNISIFESK